MRVIAGKARRLQLITAPGDETRPTTDRIKETLFNMLAPDIPGSVFLDLFAGSGGIGIEALSRGAKHAVFVEHNRRAAECIRKNLATTRLADESELIVSDADRAIRMLQGKQRFDIVFMDPPYGHLLEKQILEDPAFVSVLAPQALIIVEASLDTSFDYLEEAGYSRERTKVYKTNMHVFITRREQ